MNSSASFAGNPGGRRNIVRRRERLVGAFALCGMLISLPAPPAHTAPPFQPDNVFAAPANLPLNLQRVAVLPLAGAATDGDLADGCAALAPVVWDQLVKTKKFEAVAVSPDGLRHRTGRAAWTGAETLPPDFFDYLRREYACDAVLFLELTTYHAYAPLAIGWRLKLVDLRTGQIIWAVDELFDAAQPAVAKAARRFAGEKPMLTLLGLSDPVPLDSPRQFGRYSAAALLATLPER